MALPRDPAMLLSVVNTRLRDRYDNLTDLCEDEDVSEETRHSTLGSLGYRYNQEANRFQ